MAQKHVLKNRNFAILFAGQIVSKLGNNLYLLALPWYVYSTTGSKSALALTGFLQSIPVLLGIFVGVYVDRWHKRTTMLVVDSLRILIAFMLFLEVILHAPLWSVIVAVLLLESVGKFFNPASSSLLPLLVSNEDMVSAQGLWQSGGAAAQLLALFGGGVLMQLVGPAYLFLGNAIAFLVSVVSLLFVHADETIAASENHSLWKEWVAGLKLCVSARRLLLIGVAAMMANFAFAAMDITTTAWIKGPMHGNAVSLGLFGGLFFAGAIIGGLILGPINKRVSVMGLVTGGLLLSGALVALLGVFATLWWLLPLASILGLTNGLMNGSLNARFVTVVPPHMRGRVFGTLGALGNIMMPLGLAIYGWLLTQIPLSFVFLCIGIPVILSGLSLFIPTDADTGELAGITA